MLVWLPGFLLGCTASLIWPMMPTLPGSLAMLALAAVLLALAKRWRQAWLTSLAAFSLGSAWLVFFASVTTAWTLPQASWGADSSVTVRIQQLPRCDPRRCRLVLALESWQGSAIPRWKRPLLSVNWYRPINTELLQNQRWQLSLRLKPVLSYRNQGSFDRQRWAVANRIAAQGYVVSKAPAVLIHAPPPALRQQLDQQLRDLLHDKPQHLAWFRALLLGERDLFTSDDWWLLQQTGTGHLFAISGLHIGLVFSVVLMLARAVLGLGTVIAGFWLPLRLNLWPLAMLPALVVAAGYSALAGWSLPTLRAFTMLAIGCAVLLLHRRLSPWRIWGYCLLGNLLLDPFAVYHQGFWLSYAAVGLILLLHWSGRLTGSRWRQLGTIQLGLLIGLLPLSVWLFSLLAPLGLVANLLAVPVVGLALVPILLLGLGMLLIGAADLASQLFTVAGWLRDFLSAFLHWLSQWPLTWQVPDLPSGLIVASFVGAVLFIVPRGWPGRQGSWLVVVLVTCWWLWPQGNRQPQDWQLHVLDVGQGLSVVIERNGKALVYDTGDSWPGARSLAETIIMPFLQARGLQLDVLVISHEDRDHAGGAAWLIGETAPREVWRSAPDEPHTHRCRRGAKSTWQGLNLQFLHPARLSKNQNNTSCVLKLVDPRQPDTNSVLLTGDIEAAAERDLLQSTVHRSLAAQILIAPHHGSNSSSSAGFIQAVSPRHVIFSAGFLNRWRMPREQVVERYVEQGSHTWRTDRHGQITVSFSEAPLQVVARSQENSRWFDLLR